MCRYAQVVTLVCGNAIERLRLILSTGAEVSEIRVLQNRVSKHLVSSITLEADMTEETAEDSFTRFAISAAPRLNQALISIAGDAGRDAASESLLYGWEHWDRVQRMDNPAGYLYRVGLNQVRRARRRKRRVEFPEPHGSKMPWVEPDLSAALADLSRKQRATVMLIHGFGWTVREVAELMGVSAGTVQKHDERAMRKLRSCLKVVIDA
jgi:RNA polymerase sigma-70 factor (ECF subfamily)